MGAGEERCPAAPCPQRAGTPRLPRHPPAERGPGACLNLGKKISLHSPLLPGHGSGPYRSPHAPSPRTPVGLIKLGKIVGVRVDGVNCRDDRRG